MRKPYRHWAASLVVLLSSGCATVSHPTPADPLESFNRGVYRFNDGVDRFFLKPVAQGYQAVLPSPVREAISNFFSNLNDVYSIGNNLLQGKPGAAAEDLMRVSINTVLGLGGLIDFATPGGLPKHGEDFGQTLGVWGVKSGPYVVLPLLGPSSLRDAFGTAVEMQADLVGHVNNVAARNSATGVRIVNARAKLLDATDLLEQAALDKYSFTRDAYLQRRQYLVYDGNPPEAKEGSAPVNAP